ncbi:MAG: hypothetical protein BWX73_01262 [Lentisphaerae bacterium ADurb.Bin082]|nr:MAG: hypothetical protein BWX73_01262 [Lentisphaerae bacterium ADurb.Bin082]
MSGLSDGDAAVSLEVAEVVFVKHPLATQFRVGQGGSVDVIAGDDDIGMPEGWDEFDGSAFAILLSGADRCGDCHVSADQGHVAAVEDWVGVGLDEVLRRGGFSVHVFGLEDGSCYHQSVGADVDVQVSISLPDAIDSEGDACGEGSGISSGISVKVLGHSADSQVSVVDDIDIVIGFHLEFIDIGFDRVAKSEDSWTGCVGHQAVGRDVDGWAAFWGVIDVADIAAVFDVDGSVFSVDSADVEVFDKEEGVSIGCCDVLIPGLVQVAAFHFKEDVVVEAAGTWACCAIDSGVDIDGVAGIWNADDDVKAVGLVHDSCHILADSCCHRVGGCVKALHIVGSAGSAEEQVDIAGGGTRDILVECGQVEIGSGNGSEGDAVIGDQGEAAVVLHGHVGVIGAGDGSLGDQSDVQAGGCGIAFLGDVSGRDIESGWDGADASEDISRRYVDFAAADDEGMVVIGLQVSDFGIGETARAEDKAHIIVIEMDIAGGRGHVSGDVHVSGCQVDISGGGGADRANHIEYVSGAISPCFQQNIAACSDVCHGGFQAS